MTTTAIILAAGLGTRMRSGQPKALHPIAQQPMLRHLLASCEAAFDRIVVVTGPEMAALAEAARPHATVVQQDRLGTAHAALQAEALFGDGEVAVLFADNPLIRTATMQRLLARRQTGDAGLALLSMQVTEPNKYGRVLLQGDDVRRIVEWNDATEAERAGTLCNAGVFCAPAPDLRRWLRAVSNQNAKGEYYLTDIVDLAHREGVRVAAVEAPAAEVQGVNSRAELALAESTMQGWLRQAAMDAGATLVAPETVFLCVDTVLGPDTLVEPHVVFGPGVTVAGGGATIRSFSHLEGCQIAAGAVIGPFARVRPGSIVSMRAHVGNFVELKGTHLGAHAKANHLAYLGDAEIGAGTNIGAGTITANYDGACKHRTRIGAGSFIGSNAVLVAPVSVGDGAMITAGSVITAEVPEGAMAIGRARQVNKAGYAALFRKRKGQG